MTKILVFLLCLAISGETLGWGQTGHRVVGHIAEQHLSKKAKKRLKRVLGNESLAMVSVWMDDVRSDTAYHYTHTWHWVTIPDGMTYEESTKNEQGDVIATLNRIIAELKTGGLAKEKELENIKILVHLVGDIHQPLHVGTGLDAGGNQVKVKWFREDSNLHRVWDSGMIDSQKLSFTELAQSIDHANKTEIAQWQNTSVQEWAYESMTYRKQVYNFPENRDLGFKYRYRNWATVQKRLLQAGIRLAGIFNDIYGR